MAIAHSCKEMRESMAMPTVAKASGEGGRGEARGAEAAGEGGGYSGQLLSWDQGVGGEKGGEEDEDEEDEEQNCSRSWMEALHCRQGREGGCSLPQPNQLSSLASRPAGRASHTPAFQSFGPLRAIAVPRSPAPYLYADGFPFMGPPSHLSLPPPPTALPPTHTHTHISTQHCTRAHTSFLASLPPSLFFSFIVFVFFFSQLHSQRSAFNSHPH